MSKKRVLLTGAAGGVGSCLWQAWEVEDKYELTLTDVRPVEGARSRVEMGELRDRDFVGELCRGQDVVVTLAYVPSEDFGEEDEGLTDIGMNMQLFEASQRAGVEKVVFASSNHVTGWNEQTRELPFLSSANEYNPTGWYGAMKGMAEIAGQTLVNVYGRRFIGIRIGWFTGASEPDCLRACSTLLAPVDAAQLFSLAVDYAGPEKFLITYGTSDTTYEGHTSNLDISAAKEVLGYRPEINVMSYRSRFAD